MNWAASNQQIHTDHSRVDAPPPLLQTHQWGGPGTTVWVNTGFGIYVGEPEAWTFVLEKNGGGPIVNNDEVSIRITARRNEFFYFRTAGSQPADLIGGDGTTPFQEDTVFMIEFHEVQVGLGARPPEGEIDCQRCGPVTGTVKDSATGLPVANATVQIVGGNPYLFREEWVGTNFVVDHHFIDTTGTDGNFALKSYGRTCVPAGNMFVTARADRYQTSGIPVTVVSPAGASVPIPLVCTQVRGRVVDNSNLPIAGKLVFLLAADGITPIRDRNGNPYQATTALDGSFVFDCVPHGKAVVWTNADPNQHPPIDVPAEGLTNVMIVVQVSCGNLVGRVTDADTGLPINSATVIVIGTALETTTDANGNFTFNCVKPAGTRTLLADAAGYVSESASGTAPTTGNSSSVAITLHRMVVKEIKIRLDWDELPDDLDSHLSGPNPSGGRFHLRTPILPALAPVTFAILDTDDVDGSGPETITILRQPAQRHPPIPAMFVAGDYHYWVHNFNESTFKGSNAVVTVLVNGSQLARYHVLSATGTVDDFIWHVVDLAIDASGNVVLNVAQTLQPGSFDDVL